MKKSILLIQIAWIQAIVAMLGSLYFSDIRHYTPCVLCWYQRICMYPQVLILGIACFKKDINVLRYTIPLTMVGLVISLYHNLIYYKIISEGFVPCSAGASCTTKYFAYFGFVTIPLLSFIAFTVILISSVYAWKTHQLAH
ncbi:MAG: disulfide oxidoreductase [Candidatus Roizmanbacteria bacterium]